MRDGEGRGGPTDEREGGRDPRRRLHIVLAGSGALKGVPEPIVTLLDMHVPPDVVILLRRGLKTRPGPFERAIASFCKELWLEYRWCRPDPEAGRGSAFVRDVEMVRQADAVFAFFADDEMTGGTEHVVEKAIDQRVPVYAFGIRDGRFIRIGEHDPDEAWAETAGHLV